MVNCSVGNTAGILLIKAPPVLAESLTRQSNSSELCEQASVPYGSAWGGHTAASCLKTVLSKRAVLGAACIAG